MPVCRGWRCKRGGGDHVDALGKRCLDSGVSGVAVAVEVTGLLDGIPSVVVGGDGGVSEIGVQEPGVDGIGAAPPQGEVRVAVVR